MRKRRSDIVLVMVAVSMVSSGCGGGGEAEARSAEESGVNWSSINQALMERTASRVPPTATAPSFVVDPSWPKPLPNYWQMGNIGGIHVDHRDNIWVYQRPRELTFNEASGLGAIGQDSQGRAVDALGHLRPYGRRAEGSIPAPSVLKFDKAGNLLDAWGGPGDPGFLEQKCRPEDGCVWPAREHGIFVDHNDFVYVSGNGEIRRGTSSGEYPWAPNFGGDDSHILKFTADGTFIYQIGHAGITSANSNAVDGGPNGTPQPYLPAGVTVDPRTNRMYIADGYGNRRILVVDAETGQYIAHFGAYGQNPVDDGAALNPPDDWADEYRRGEVPNFFRGPVHCVEISNDGLIYVCDRGNNRIQIFRADEVGGACSNPGREVGRCGFVGEVFVSPQTPSGTSGAVSFSPDPGQTCMYVPDLANNTVYVINRENLHEMDRIGRTGRQVGEFVMAHGIAIDSEGSFYTGEVGDARRVQKFQRYGATGCSGTHLPVVGQWDVYPAHR